MVRDGQRNMVRGGERNMVWGRFREHLVAKEKVRD